MKGLEFLTEILKGLDINPAELSKEELVETLKEALEDADDVEFAKFEESLETLKLFHPQLFHQLSDSLTSPFRENDNNNLEGE